MADTNTNARIQKAMRAVRRGKLEPARRLLTEVVTAEPDNELGWLWLARAADPNDPEQKANALNQVLRINPHNTWAADELAAAQPDAPQPKFADTAAKQDLMPKKQFGEMSLDLIRCPNCAGQVEIHGNEVLSAECPHCQTLLDLGGEVPKAGDKLKKYRPGQPIKPGDIATFDGKKHQVIGWLRFKGWDDEDSWTWVEWLLAREDGSYRWLSYSAEDGFQFHKPLPIETKFDLDKGFPVLGASVTERSPARIVALRGEMTWRAKVGDDFRYIDARKGNKRYSVEYTPAAMELTEGTPLTPAEVWTAFGRAEKVQQIAEGKAESKYWLLRRDIAWGFAALFLLLIAFSYVAGGRIFQGTTTVSQNAPVGSMGSFVIEQAGRPHQIDIRISSLPTNSWAVLDILIMDEAENEYYIASAEFWDEDGYDEDGYWRENDLTGRAIFRPEEAGTYTMLVEFDEATITNDINTEVDVYQGIWLSRYFLGLAVFSVILGFIFNVVADSRRVK